MSSIYQTVISIISKPIEKRDDSEINSVLAWFTNLFRKKSTVFGDVSQEIIRDIIKNCNCETKVRDDIIIRQGDKGDCFYINLRGKVSIYINHKKHDVEDDIQEDNVEQEDGDRKEKSIRDRLGNYVTSLEAGEGFGEIALVSDDDRTASIIADETTDLMVVNKALYKRCLQAPALRKLAEKQNFINQSPFFGNWSQKMKKLLSLCLEREIVRYDSYLGKQGEPADKIYFILKGQAKVIVDQTVHVSQYPRLYPLKLPENEGQEIISTWMEEKRNQSDNTITNNKNEIQFQRKNSQAIVRRTFTFAEAEQRIKIKNIELGILGPGEISGLCEIIMDMPTYMQSTKCMEDCDVFYIYKRSYDRLIAKRNPLCINKMREHVYLKLQARNSRLKLTNPITFFRSLEYRLELLINGRKKSIFGSLSNNNIASSNLNGLKLPPRGPIILDIKPKQKQTSKKQNRFISNLTQSINTNAEKLNKSDPDDSLNSSNSNDLENSNINEPNVEKYDSERKKSIEKLFDLEFASDQALNDLEERIKQWHLQNGCKNPLLKAFHRIDVEKIKNSIKSGGKITLKPRNVHSNDQLMNRHSMHRESGSSGLSSGSGDNNDSDDENSAYLNSEYMNNNQMKLFPNNSLTTVAATVTGVLNGNFIANDSQIYNNNNNIEFIDENYYCHHQQRHSIQIITCNNNNNQMIDNLQNKFVHFNNNNNNEGNRNYSKRRSLPIKLNDNNLQEIFNHNSNNFNDNNNKRLSSFLSHHSSLNIQYTPYLFRKLSMSQVKSHKSAKKTYSKEEYLLLKDELRRQTRRYSVTSAHL